VRGGWRVRAKETVPRCHLALGNVDDARLAAERARFRADVVGLPVAAAVAQRAVAEVELGAGDPETAARLALVSAEGAEQAGAPVFHSSTSRGYQPQQSSEHQ